MPPVGFEPTISAVERPQTHALDSAATGTGTHIHIIVDHMYTQLRFAPDLLERHYCTNLGVPDKQHEVTSQIHVLFIVCPGRTANLRVQRLFCLSLFHFLIFVCNTHTQTHTQTALAVSYGFINNPNLQDTPLYLGLGFN